MLIYGRNQHNIVKQLSSIKNKKKISENFLFLWESQLENTGGFSLTPTPALETVDFNFRGVEFHLFSLLL